MELPEIRLYVGGYLNNHDLTSCILVSKHWQESFTAILYRTWIASTHDGHWSSFERHLCHIQDLQVGHQTTTFERDCFLEHCQRLRRFKIELQLHGRDNEFVFKILKGNPRLIRVDLEGIDQDTTPDLLDTIADHCSRATELFLSIKPFNSCEFWDRFMIRMAPKLTRLELNWSQPYPLTTRGAPPEFPELRELIVSSKQIHVSWQKQLELFERCPKLESLSWCLISSSDLPRPIWGFTQTLISLLQGKCCDDSRPHLQLASESGCNGDGGDRSCCWPRLDSIRIDEMHPIPQLDDRTLAEILNSCPNRLRRLTLPGTEFGARSWKALQRHLETVEVLYVSTNSWMIQEILASAPQLREFRGGVLWARELVDSSFARKMTEMGLEMKAGIRNLQQPQQPEPQSQQLQQQQTQLQQPLAPGRPRPWVCLQLRVLKIFLFWAVEKEDYQQVFEQLRKLRLLTELYLCNATPTAGSGMDPRAALEMDTESFEDNFGGEYRNRQRMQNEPVGRRLLEIWPGLSSCLWHNPQKNEKRPIRPIA